MNLRSRVCPYCGNAYDTKRPLLREDGVTTAYVHGNVLCVGDDERMLQEVWECAESFYETDDE